MVSELTMALKEGIPPEVLVAAVGGRSCCLLEPKGVGETSPADVDIPWVIVVTVAPLAVTSKLLDRIHLPGVRVILTRSPNVVEAGKLAKAGAQEEIN